MENQINLLQHTLHLPIMHPIAKSITTEKQMYSVVYRNHILVSKNNLAVCVLCAAA